MGDFSGKINKLSCHGVVVGLWGYLNALAFSTLAAHLGGGMNPRVVTLLSEVLRNRHDKYSKGRSVVARADSRLSILPRRWSKGRAIRSDPHFPPEINGPAVGDDRGPSLLLAHGLGISGRVQPVRWRVAR